MGNVQKQSARGCLYATWDTCRQPPASRCLVTTHSFIISSIC